MGLSKEEIIERKNDKHVQYITSHICNKDGDKPYVFISYKSDDWKVVLKDIVYILVHDYHLNVYFDGDFDDHNALWTVQFPENMQSNLCKGVLVFLDDKYATSYATLLELMYSQAGCQDENYEFVKKEVIPIYIEQLTIICDDADTGLGNEKYSGYAEQEKDLFDRTFDNAIDKKKKIFKKALGPYNKTRDQSKPLSRKLCSTMVKELISYIGSNDNIYDELWSWNSIVNTIKDACGPEVFSPDAVSPEPLAIPKAEVLEAVQTAPAAEADASADSSVPLTWRYTGKDADARLVWDGEGRNCTVLAGSRAGTEAAGFSKLPAAKKLKESLIEQGVLVNDTFVRDYDCSKVSTMINVLNGGSVSMPLEIKSRHLAPENEINKL